MTILDVLRYSSLVSSTQHLRATQDPEIKSNHRHSSLPCPLERKQEPKMAVFTKFTRSIPMASTKLSLKLTSGSKGERIEPSSPPHPASRPPASRMPTTQSPAASELEHRVVRRLRRRERYESYSKWTPDEIDLFLEVYYHDKLPTPRPRSHPNTSPFHIEHRWTPLEWDGVRLRWVVYSLQGCHNEEAPESPWNSAVWHTESNCWGIYGMGHIFEGVTAEAMVFDPHRKWMYLKDFDEWKAEERRRIYPQKLREECFTSVYLARYNEERKRPARNLQERTLQTRRIQIHEEEMRAFQERKNRGDMSLDPELYGPRPCKPLG